MSGDMTEAMLAERAQAIEELSLTCSQQEIADRLGVSRKVVRNYQRVLGITPIGRPPGKAKREGKTARFEITTGRSQVLAESAARRLTDGLSEINGICRGLKDLDLGMAAAALGDNTDVWARKSKELSMFLNGFHKQLKEVAENGAA